MISSPRKGISGLSSESNYYHDNIPSSNPLAFQLPATPKESSKTDTTEKVQLDPKIDNGDCAVRSVAKYCSMPKHVPDSSSDRPIEVDDDYGVQCRRSLVLESSDPITIPPKEVMDQDKTELRLPGPAGSNLVSEREVDVESDIEEPMLLLSNHPNASHTYGHQDRPSYKPKTPLTKSLQETTAGLYDSSKVIASATGDLLPSNAPKAGVDKPVSIPKRHEQDQTKRHDPPSESNSSCDQPSPLQKLRIPRSPPSSDDVLEVEEPEEQKQTVSYRNSFVGLGPEEQDRYVRQAEIEYGGAKGLGKVVYLKADRDPLGHLLFCNVKSEGHRPTGANRKFYTQEELKVYAKRQATRQIFKFSQLILQGWTVTELAGELAPMMSSKTMDVYRAASKYYGPQKPIVAGTSAIHRAELVIQFSARIDPDLAELKAFMTASPDIVSSFIKEAKACKPKKTMTCSKIC